MTKPQARTQSRNNGEYAWCGSCVSAAALQLLPCRAGFVLPPRHPRARSCHLPSLSSLSRTPGSTRGVFEAGTHSVPKGVKLSESPRPPNAFLTGAVVWGARVGSAWRILICVSLPSDGIVGFAQHVVHELCRGFSLHGPELFMSSAAGSRLKVRGAVLMLTPTMDF